MKYLKLFESFSKIEEICKKYNIQNYTINNDGTVDVDGNVNLNFIDLTELPIKFRKVTGNFECFNNKLTTLNGCPKEVSGVFNCSYNKLTSLEGSPMIIGGSLYCDFNNKLTTLNGCTKEVGGNFQCNNNKLTSLEGGPEKVGGYFNCSGNKLTTLEGSHIEVGGYFYCINNRLKSLEGCPKKIGGFLDCRYNRIYTLDGLEDVQFKKIYLESNPISKLYDFTENEHHIELFQFIDPIREPHFNGDETGLPVVILSRLNDFYAEVGLPDVTRVKGYSCI